MKSLRFNLFITITSYENPGLKKNLATELPADLCPWDRFCPSGALPHTWLRAACINQTMEKRLKFPALDASDPLSWRNLKNGWETNK
jgi:hypothetical protein